MIEPMKLSDLLEIKPNVEAEQAYRRGVQQAMGMIGAYLHKQGHADAAHIADIACDIAGEMRADIRQPYPVYLYELEKRLREEQRGSA